MSNCTEESPSKKAKVSKTYGLGEILTNVNTGATIPDAELQEHVNKLLAKLGPKKKVMVRAFLALDAGDHVTSSTFLTCVAYAPVLGHAGS